MRPLASALALIGFALAACGTPQIEDDLGSPDDETKLPDRGAVPTTDGGSSGGGDTGTTTPPAGDVNVTVTLTGTGTGTITSTPPGVTCTGTTCKGTFPRGTKVSLAASPAAGVVFVAWSGACIGTAPCAAIADADVTVSAELASLEGTWSGTYTNNRMAGGCTFNNKGNLSTVITGSATLAGTEEITGLELRNLNGCALAGTTTGTAPSEPVTATGNVLTGTWTFAVNGAAGTLAFPYTAKVTGKTITGSWTCTGCTGSFTLTKP